MTRALTGVMLFAAAALLCGCPKPVVCDPEVDDCSDGGNNVPPDVCNSKDDALNDPQCALNVTSASNPALPDGGSIKLGYLSAAGDQDWYSAKLPALTARSLVHISAGYGAPATPVNLAVSVLKDDAASSLARKIDHHGAAAPKPVDIIFPYAAGNSTLLILLGDEGATNQMVFDVRNPYSVQAEVIENPDLNEPNDTMPTVIPLAAGGPGIVGQAKGVIATDNDVDKFTFTAPGGRKVLYLHITMPQLNPPPPFRLAYTLFDSTGTPISEGQASNEFVPVDLATARLTSAGAYTLSIYGYKSPNQTEVTPGELRSAYTVDVQIMDDLDVNEPNDSIMAPKVVPMAYGSSTSFVGRLGYVPDPDIFGLDLAATANWGVIRYKLTMNPGAMGRFPPLVPASDRQLRVVKLVTGGATLQDNIVACTSDPVVCPKGYEGSTQNQGLVEGLCTGQNPPWCLLAERNEDKDFQPLRNMVGAVPVPPHAAVQRYFLFVQDDGSNYADDRDYTISISYEADPDDTTRNALPYQTQTGALIESASFPVPSASGEVSGVLTHGYGRVINNQIDQGQGIRASNDYDGTPTDYDRFEFTFPAVTMPYDRTWALEWEVSHNDAGAPPGDLALEVGFCTTATTADGGCGAVIRTLAYSSDTLQPWYGTDLMSRGVLWTKVKGANSTVITATPLGCFCFEPRFISTGHFTFRVGAVDRNSNDPISYRVRQSLAPYPASYTKDGGTLSCPVVGDGGGSCQFTK